MAKYALLVGVNEYRDAAFNSPKPLRFAEEDARTLARELEEVSGFETRVLVGPEATHDAVIGVLERGWLLARKRKLSKGDQFLFSFAGHGQLLVPGNRFVIHPFDAAPGSERRSFTVERLMEFMESNVGAGQCVCVLDACRNLVSCAESRETGCAFDEKGSRDIEAAVKHVRGKDLQVLFACREGERSYEDEELGHGVLTHFFAESLRRCAGRGETTFGSVMEETGERMKTWRHPRLKETQRPRFYGDPAKIVLVSAEESARRIEAALEAKGRELTVLERAEAEARAAEGAQAKELAEKEKELAALDRTIAEKKARLAKSGLAAGDSSLDAIHAMVKRKEEEKRELDGLRRKTEEERRRRQEEFGKLREKENAKKAEALAKDLAKYREIASSDVGKEMAQAAWGALLRGYGLNAGAVPVGRIAVLYRALGLAAPCPVFTEWPFDAKEARRRQEKTAEALELPVEHSLDLGKGVKLELVLVPAGEFMMGSPEDERVRGDDEGPVHRVRIARAFYMGKYEVTRAQYEAVMGANPSDFKGADRPVEEVSWDDATEFCRKLIAKCAEVGIRRYPAAARPEPTISGGDAEAHSRRVPTSGATLVVRLPREAEWEYACRAGTTTPFHFGETISTDQVNYDGNYPYAGGAKGRYREKTTSAGSFPANAWGLHDMHGNIREWCFDWYDEGYYAKSPGDDPTGPATGGSRVVRGGSWDGSGDCCPSAFRDGCGPTYGSTFIGFRVAVAAP